MPLSEEEVVARRNAHVFMLLTTLELTAIGISVLIITWLFGLPKGGADIMFALTAGIGTITIIVEMISPRGPYEGFC